MVHLWHKAAEWTWCHLVMECSQHSNAAQAQVIDAAHAAAGDCYQVWHTVALMVSRTP